MTLPDFAECGCSLITAPGLSAPLQQAQHGNEDATGLRTVNGAEISWIGVKPAISFLLLARFGNWLQSTHRHRLVVFSTRFRP